MVNQCSHHGCEETQYLKRFKNSDGVFYYCREHRGLDKERPATLADCVAILERFENCHFSSGCDHDAQYDDVMEVLRDMVEAEEKAKAEAIRKAEWRQGRAKCPTCGSKLDVEGFCPNWVFGLYEGHSEGSKGG